MKNLALIILVATFAVSGCHHGMRNGVVGSGKRQIQKREIPAFTSITAEGAFVIDVTCQKDTSLEIEADDNILPLIMTEVSNGVLHLKSVKGYSVSEPVKLRLSTPNLEGLSVTGAGKIDVSGIKNDKFEIDSDGASAIVASGTTKVVDIDVSGAVKIDTHRLHAARAIVDSKGVSNVEVDATEQLEVTISGPSHVSYYGDPAVSQTIHGPGKLEKKQSSGA
jgi:hypothetical protein